MSQVEINRRQVSTQAGPHGDRLAGYTDDVGGRDRQALGMFITYIRQNVD